MDCDLRSSPKPSERVVSSLGSALLVLALAACEPPPPEHVLIPAPALFERATADTFFVTADTPIVFDSGDAEGQRVARFLAALIGNTTETTPDVVPSDDPPGAPAIRLTRTGADPLLGPEGYRLTVDSSGATVASVEAAGLFYGVQTIRQLLPALVEYTAAYTRPLYLSAVEIRDSPRFEWRGSMLDVSRHFFGPVEVKRFIDLMALYKLNRLHLHLSDDQGWRIEIPSRPELTRIGSTTEVGGGEGGYFSTNDYVDLVGYAADRFITIVPEIDMPGHTNAALASYPELNCDGVARDLYTGTEVGFSSLCVEREATYRFIEDVVGDIAAVTPGPWFHMGGDEVTTLSEDEYNAFVQRTQTIVAANGKRMVGWDEVLSANLAPGSLVQLWRPLWPEGGESGSLDSSRAAAAAKVRENLTRAVEAGVKFIASPADRVYLDMKYEPSTVLGLSWAGFADERTSYDWDITDIFSAIPEHAIAGIEAPLWAETIGTMADIEHMAFPRLAGVAEHGWSNAGDRDWESYRARVAAHTERWEVLGVNYRRDER